MWGRKKDGGKRKQESYQSCCQSLGQVVIRKAVWQRLVSISPSLSFSISPSHTHKAGERLCCVPLCHPWVNAVQVRWTAWQPFVDCILGQKDERKHTDGKTWGKIHQEKGVLVLQLQVKCLISLPWCLNSLWPVTVAQARCLQGVSFQSWAVLFPHFSMMTICLTPLCRNLLYLEIRIPERFQWRLLMCRKWSTGFWMWSKSAG